MGKEEHTSVAMLRSTAALSLAGVAAHAGKAACAASTAASTSSAEPAGMLPMTSSVAGLTTSSRWPRIAGTRLPAEGGVCCLWAFAKVASLSVTLFYTLSVVHVTPSTCDALYM